MAYETGQATSPANLLTAIETFAASSGWSAAGGIISRGTTFVRLVAVDSEILTIEGDTDGNFTAGLCPQFAKIDIPAALWPVTYRFFSFGSPDFFAAVMQYDADKVQQLWFGAADKYGSWTGGSWFGASNSEVSNGIDYYLDATRAGGYVNKSGENVFGTGAAAPFWGTPNRDTFTGSKSNLRCAFVHAEIDGWIWPGADANTFAYPDHPELAQPLHASRQPNVWNSQAVLFPIWLHFARPQYYSTIGILQRMRTLKIDAFNIGDILTIGSDRWMVFPWYRKDASAPNGGINPDGEINHTGNFGVAFEYDGP